MAQIKTFVTRFAAAILLGLLMTYAGCILIDWIFGPVLFRYSNGQIIQKPTLGAYTFNLIFWMYQRISEGENLIAIRDALQAISPAPTLLLRLSLVFIASLCLGFGISFWRMRPLIYPRITSGIKYLDKRRAIEAARKHFKAVRRNQRHIAVNPPINLAPDVPITVDQETMGIFVEGGMGSGKTIIFRHLMDQAIAREDQLIIFDTKDDYTAKIKDRLVVNPFAENTARWNIADDVLNSTQADEVASMLVRSDGQNADFWSNAGHTILKGLFIILIRTMPRKWTFADFYRLLQKDSKELAPLIREHYPIASKFVAGNDGGMEAGAIATVAAYVRQFIEPLAMAWGDENDNRPSFSVFSWLAAGNGKGRVLVLQLSSRYQAASVAWIRMVLNLVAGVAIDPVTKEYGPNRVWVFLDELPTLGKITRLNDLVDKGRSKGFRTVIACQSLHQLHEAYGDWAKSVDASIGIRIYSRINPSERSHDACRFLGETTRRTRQIQVTKKDFATSTTERDDLEKSLVISPEDLLSLGTQGENGVDAICVGWTQYALRLNWPYPEIRKSIHPEYQPAALDESILYGKPAETSARSTILKSVDAQLSAALEAFDNKEPKAARKKRK